MIPVRRLFDEQMKTFTFKGEAEVMKELDFLAHGREKRKIYMLQGDNELDLNSKETLEFTSADRQSLPTRRRSLAEALAKDNYEVSGLSFRPASPDDKSTNIVHVGEGDGKKAEVPPDCDTLMILAPSAPLSNVALDAIERYLDRDGRLFVNIGLPGESDFSKLKDTGLEGLLKKYGVDVTSEFVMHYPSNRFPDPFDGHRHGERQERDGAGQAIRGPRLRAGDAANREARRVGEAQGRAAARLRPAFRGLGRGFAADLHGRRESLPVGEVRRAAEAGGAVAAAAAGRRDGDERRQAAGSRDRRGGLPLERWRSAPIAGATTT